jgi:DNA-binding MarR family transcriptional regulator
VKRKPPGVRNSPAHDDASEEPGSLTNAFSGRLIDFLLAYRLDNKQYSKGVAVLPRKPDVNLLLEMARRYSTAIVLFQHGVAERAGLGASDHKCLEILRERGPMTGSELASTTGLTTGAITGVVARLESRGFLTREPDPRDARKQTLRPSLDRIEELHADFALFRKDVAALIAGLDAHQQAGLAKFLEHGAAIAIQHATLARSPAVVTIRSHLR